MERGTVSLTNAELSSLYNFAVAEGCEKEDLLTKLAPVPDSGYPNQEHAVLISEEDAEVLLDCMPAPSEITDEVLAGARNKVQQFLSQVRFAKE